MDAPGRVTPPALKSVSIMWAEGVSSEEAKAVVGTVRDLIRVIYDICLKGGVTLGPTEIRPFGTWVIPSIPAGDPYSGTHWYIDSATDHGQVVAGRFLELVKQEPWQQARPHFDVAVIDRELTEGSGEPLLAAVLPGTATVISVAQLRLVSDEKLRLAGLRRLVVHCFGQVMELGSCENPCVMRDARSLTDLMDRVGEQRENNVLFCPDCRSKILRAVLIQRISKN